MSESEILGGLMFDPNDFSVPEGVGVNDPIREYLEEAALIPALEAEEEALLAAKAAEGDEEAIEALINGNLRLPICIAREFNDGGLPFSDLVQEGNFGLVEAAGDFGNEASGNISFREYAVWKIRNSIQDALYALVRDIGVAQESAATLNKAEEIRKVIEANEDREASDEELAQKVGVTAERLQAMRDLVK
ncbi:MAG: sigma-70 family RNA polymerase sigma factor [Lachnospiraceae bacterium]|nr:sigma-70 family RNA polymerase sigma factor [Lachnospiraceae bacterium]